MKFTKATRKRAKLRLALSGPSGSGKTFSALRLAAGIGGKIAVLDSEHGSASLYSDIVDFDVLEIEAPYTPERYIEAVRSAAEAGYDTLILDSITHEWKGAGGVLEIVDTLARTKYRGNSYAAWGEADPRHRAFIDSMLQAPIHIIATMRSKTAYVETEKAGGKKAYQKAGMAPEQRDGVEYEFTVVFDLTNDGNFASVSKDRTNLFRDPFVITEETGAMLRDWLESGAEPAPARTHVDDAIAKLAELASGAELTALRNATRDRCARTNDRAGYARFAEALKARIDELERAQERQREPDEQSDESYFADAEANG